MDVVNNVNRYYHEVGSESEIDNAVNPDVLYSFAK
jgi:hypothetical protein